MASIDQVAFLATFGSVWAVLAVAHNLADHVIGQTDHQAAGKAAPSEAEIADGASPRRGWGLRSALAGPLAPGARRLEGVRRTEGGRDERHVSH